ncbi:MAG: hypothetical protein M1829_002243 [Trizodia sp. TS-e1964]|nr:MAG: hypothetical protein M1829_002243 [Trizodia sp. TS-e1964]
MEYTPKGQLAITPSPTLSQPELDPDNFRLSSSASLPNSPTLSEPRRYSKRLNPSPKNPQGMISSRLIAHPASSLSIDRHGPSGNESAPSRRQSSPLPDARSVEPVTYTLVTRRISKAKKGKRVHSCKFEGCTKVFTRNEHLKRHQLNHSTEASYRCEFPNCSKSFHRSDLLNRHMERHNSQDKTDQPVASHRGSPALSQDDSYNSPPAFLQEVQPTLRVSVTPAPQDSLFAPALQFQPFPPSQVVPSSEIDSDDMPLLSIPQSGSLMPGSFYASSADESPLWSGSGAGSVSSSTSEYQAIQQFPAPAIPYNTPTRARSTSAVSAVDPWYSFSSNSPLHPNSASTAWPLAEDIASMTRGMDSLYEGDYLQPVGIPAWRNPPLDTHLPPTELPTQPIFNTTFPELDRGIWLDLQSLTTKEAITSDASSTLAVAEGSLGGIHANLQLYWQKFDPTFPIVHRPTVFSNATPLLLASMVAIGAQYSKDNSARRRASEIHQSVKKSLGERCPITNTSSITDIQAVLLTEAFAMFRSEKKSTQKPPGIFRNIYLNLVSNSQDNSLEPFNVYFDVPFKTGWSRWIEGETRRRLLLAAFQLDVQQSTLFEQPVVKGDVGNLLLPCPQDLWVLDSPDEWGSIIKKLNRTSMADILANIQSVGSPNHQLDTFSTSVFLAWIVSQKSSLTRFSLDNALNSMGHTLSHSLDCSSRISYHASMWLTRTPIRSLLAVAGESWVPGEKLSAAADFDSTKSHLRKWTSTPDAATATWHAIQTLRIYFGGSGSRSSASLSDQWSIYISALICWAYGIALAPPAVIQQSHGDYDALEYLTAMGDAPVDSIAHMPQRWKTQGVLKATALAIAGSHSGMLKEGEKTLTKLASGGLSLY